jgi:hypothetical protein
MSALLAGLASLGFSQLSSTGPSAPVANQLQSTLLAAALRPGMCYAYSVAQASSLLIALADLGWTPTAGQWSCLYGRLLRRAGAGAAGAEVAHLLFCLAQYKGRIGALREAAAAGAAAANTALPTSSSTDAQANNNESHQSQPQSGTTCTASEGTSTLMQWVPPKRFWTTRMLGHVRGRGSAAASGPVCPACIRRLAWCCCLVRGNPDPCGFDMNADA